MDKQDISHKTQVLQLEEIAKVFKIIDDDSFPVLVPYKEGSHIIKSIEKNPYDLSILRKAQRYIVNVRYEPYKRLRDSGNITEIDGKIGILTNKELYDENLGLSSGNSFSYTPEELIL